MADERFTEFTITNDSRGTRLDVFLTEHLERVTRSQVRRLIDDNHVKVNGEQVKAGHQLEVGMLVSVAMPPVDSSDLVPVAMDLDIIFEDDHVIVVNKPAGLVMHPGAGQNEKTLVHGLMAHCGKNLSYLGEHSRPGIVHRLDKDTSGVVVCAKTEAAHQHLAAQFEQKSNYRQYTALLDGRMSPGSISADHWLARDPANRTRFRAWRADEDDRPENAKRAVSHFELGVTYLQRLSLVAVQLETGRTHQIRVQAAALGMPVVGDYTYHRPVQLPEAFPQEVRTKLAAVNRQLLHARYLGIEHPVTGQKMAFKSPLPDDFQDILDTLRVFADGVIP